MKYLIPVLTLILLLISCKTEEKVNEDGSGTFTVEGKIIGAEGKKLFLQSIQTDRFLDIGQTQIGADGTFSIQGEIKKLELFQLSIENDPNATISFPIQAGETLELTLNYPNISKQFNIRGSKSAELQTKHVQQMNSFKDRVEKAKPASEEELFALQKKEFVRVEKFTKEAMKNAPENPYNYFLINNIGPIDGFENWDESNLEILKNVYQSISAKYPKSTITSNFRDQILQLEKSLDQFNSYETNNNGTITPPEINLPSPSGKKIALSSLKGKVVLIDFWASWCGPCRRENPNVVALYEKYKNDGFTVYSVSLDKDKEAWKAAIIKDNLHWDNHVSDLKFWDSQVVKNYNIKGIPHTVLLNKEGKIIGTGLAGTELEQKLKETLKK